MKYIYIIIGCLECGEETQLVGIFNSKEEVLEAVNSDQSKFCGSNIPAVFDITTKIDLIEYNQKLKKYDLKDLS